jgi:hypothetical protein
MSGINVLKGVPPDFKQCANEGELCNFPGKTAVVTYGASQGERIGYITKGNLQNGVNCTNDVFGDPIYGVVKSCYMKESHPEKPIQDKIVNTVPPTYKFCADEHQQCTFDGKTGNILYGANDKFVSKENVTNKIACSNEVFGDPIYGVVKACYLELKDMPSSGLPKDFKHCADEGGRCEFHGRGVVSYGKSTNDRSGFSTIENAKDGIDCNNNIFGDPLYGVAKSCYVSEFNKNPSGVPDNSYQCANEGGRCDFKGKKANVSYGATQGDKSIFTTLNNIPEGVDCNNNVFGDPIYGVVKSCYASEANQSIVSSDFHECATEGGRCDFRGKKATVTYGAVTPDNSKAGFATISNLKDGVDCNNNTFGDPIYGVVKKCYAKEGFGNIGKMEHFGNINKIDYKIILIVIILLLIYLRCKMTKN